MQKKANVSQKENSSYAPKLTCRLIFLYFIVVNPDDATGAALEAALVEVADCKSFQGKSDKWELQRWAWNEYDPAFFHLSLRQHQNASEVRPNSLDSKDRSITAMPYAPFPPPAHRSFTRLRRDITSDSAIIAVIYRALHVHCRDVVGEDDKFVNSVDNCVSVSSFHLQILLLIQPIGLVSNVHLFFFKQESYQTDAMSETILGRVIHLLTLGTYAWESPLAEKSECWSDDGGGDVGSVFHNFPSPPTHADWVENILLVRPDKIMGSNLYTNEKNILQLLSAIVAVGGSDRFKIQDRSIRCGAAWLCEYAARHNLNAAKVLGDREKASNMVGSEDALETDKQRRRREAKERVMKNIHAQQARFANSMQSNDDSDIETPTTPGVSSSMLIDKADHSTRITPKTSETRTEYFDSPKDSGPGLPILDKQMDSFETRIQPGFVPRLLQERPKCIICADDGVFAHETESSDMKDDNSLKAKKKILTWCGFIQPSTVARGGGGVPPDAGDHISHLVGTHISLCGHAIHASCCESHLKDSGQREERLFERQDKRVAFKCPLCRRLSNCLVPFIDVGESWALPDGNTSELSRRRTTSLHDFLDRSQWWTTKNDDSVVWNGRCSFIPKDLWDINDNAQSRAISFGKKDLCKSWSSALWTTPNIARVPEQEMYVQSTSSTGVTVVWRRILDQISEISYKADSKRIGEENLQQNLGEFRHYLVEKVAYNQGNLLSNEVDPAEVSTLSLYFAKMQCCCQIHISTATQDFLLF